MPSLGVYSLLGAAVITLFFLWATPIIHDVWTVDDPERRQTEMTNFLNNATLFGAALVLAACSTTAWLYAFNIGL